MTIFDCFLVGVGGFAGAICRFGVAEISRWAWAGPFPVGTLIANVTGCFLIGMLIGSGRADYNKSMRLSFGVGFLGALTTFSTFGAETVQQAQAGGVAAASLNVAANLVGGLVAVVAGIYLGQRLVTMTK